MQLHNGSETGRRSLITGGANPAANHGGMCVCGCPGGGCSCKPHRTIPLSRKPVSGVPSGIPTGIPSRSQSSNESASKLRKGNAERSSFWARPRLGTLAGVIVACAASLFAMSCGGGLSPQLGAAIIYEEEIAENVKVQIKLEDESILRLGSEAENAELVAAADADAISE